MCGVLRYKLVVRQFPYLRKIGAIAVAASFVQLIGYGTGFLRAFWSRIILKNPEFGAFEHNFYK